MAKFEIEGQEGIRFVKVTIDDETVQAESGALCSMTGDIVMSVKIPSIGAVLKSYLSEESRFRPAYTGTGVIILESTFGGYHILDLDGESWIVESGAYWASEASVTLSAYREKMWTSLWAGEGLIDWQTKVSGHGKVVLASSGPVDEVVLEAGKRLVANGKYVVARSVGVSYRVGRATKSFLASRMSAEGLCRFYEGPGRVLVSSVPYWRYRMFAQKTEQSQEVVTAN